MDIYTQVLETAETEYSELNKKNIYTHQNIKQVYAGILMGIFIFSEKYN